MGMYPHKYEWSSGTQQNGDCSIWIRAAQLEFDDGNWECQVTASDFHTQDALTSQPVHLVVRGKHETQWEIPTILETMLESSVFVKIIRNIFKLNVRATS